MKYILSLLLLLIFTGCLPKQDDVTKVFQTKSSDDKLRIYAHCSPKSQKLNIVLLNLSKHDINYEIDQMIESSLEVKSAKKEMELGIGLKTLMILGWLVLLFLAIANGYNLFIKWYANC